LNELTQKVTEWSSTKCSWAVKLEHLHFIHLDCKRNIQIIMLFVCEGKCTQFQCIRWRFVCYSTCHMCCYFVLICMWSIVSVNGINNYWTIFKACCCQRLCWWFHLEARGLQKEWKLILKFKRFQIRLNIWSRNYNQQSQKWVQILISNNLFQINLDYK